MFQTKVKNDKTEMAIPANQAGGRVEKIKLYREIFSIIYSKHLSTLYNKNTENIKQVDDQT